VFEQSERLEETGAGIQLSPNAARTLIDFGLESRLRPHVVAPAGLCVLNARTGREIVHMPLGAAAAQRYGAPYWVIHRGDLQAVLVAATQDLGVTIKLGMRVHDVVPHANAVTVSGRGRTDAMDERGLALIAADGLWSQTRMRIGCGEPPHFAGHTAWRALVSTEDVDAKFREPVIHLWLGRDAHLVHYPVKGGRLINVVVITADTWNAPGWSEPAARADLLPRLSPRGWAPQALSLAGIPDAWLKWALHEHRPLRHWSHGPVGLLGDAAHPVLPYLAQGAAMAIEDAAVVAHCLARMPDNPSAALQRYEAARRARAQKVQRLAARNGARYHLTGVRATLRDAAMRVIGGARLLHHYDWLYDWRPPTTLAVG
jgi:2-polyprenyl-6-methoxyphenol hydroxylase-like FAD-dependent oxidoreductase